MDLMSLTVVDATGNKREQVRVPPNVAAGRILAKLVPRLNLPQTDSTGALVSYKFHHKQSGRQLNDNMTLLECGVANDDVLRLVAEITAGGR